MGKNGRCSIISQNILEQIELARQALTRHSDYDFLLQNRLYGSLHEEAVRHSIELEFPSNKKRLLRRGRALRLAEKRLKEARIHFAGEFNLKFNGRLSEELLRETLGFILPDLGDYPAYRSSGGFSFTNGVAGPYMYPNNVDGEMQQFFLDNGSLDEHFACKSVHAHLHLARIHPFQDGNGRLARLVQNEVLAYRGYPPIVLYSGERQQYLFLIEQAARSYREAKEITPEQQKFYDYLAMKLYTSLEEVNKQRS